MTVPALRPCRVNGCGQTVLPPLHSEYLCIDHFLHQTFARASQALDDCRRATPIPAADLESLLDQEQLILRMILEEKELADEARWERVLELLLCLQNLHEYVNHHSVALSEPK